MSRNYKHFNTLGKHFSFGEAKTSVHLKFGYKDSMSGEFKSSYSCKLETISSLYNLATTYSRIVSLALLTFNQAAYMNLEGDGIKEASKLFQHSAWLFEHIKLEAAQLHAADFSSDFSNENLSMMSHLMLA